jgi:GAF domain-containing protein/HAMP domain-containing protein
VNPTQNPLLSDAERNTHASRWWLGALPALLFAGSELAALFVAGNRAFWAALPVLIAAPFAYWLVRSGRSNTGNILFMIVIGVQSVLMTLFQKGLGFPNALTASALIAAIGLGTLPRKQFGRVVMWALFAAIATVLIDVFGSDVRPSAEFNQGRWIFMAVILAVSFIFLARQILALDIRTKIVLGILGSGGLALAVAVAFMLAQGQQITDALSQRLDLSVRQLAEEHLNNTAFVEARQADRSFEAVTTEAVDLAQSWVLLRNKARELNAGAYWDASTRLKKLEGGQYGNSATDPSSVFVPVWTPLDDSVISDLNLSAYLDFHAPQLLNANPALLAVYAIDTRGITRYYPNIELASLLPPDFDATRRPYFTITSPLFNPQRLPRWTIPYVDATGGGLVVTVAAPVYDRDEFLGVVAADMQLAQITEQISSIKIGQTGYAFMIDDAGRILAMPPAGYEMFGIRPEDMNSEEFFKQTILGRGSLELQALTKRMASGGNGLLIIDNQGIDTYVSYARIVANGYSIALVVPVSELQEAIISARNQTQQQLRSATQAAAVILIILLMVAVIVSLALGQVIAAPIQRLTQVASQIAAGNLSVKATSTSTDETGILADAFNTMTTRLHQTLDGLEHTVEERTAALYSANEKNERRARQFESIAQVARTISSTRDLDVLLPQITAVISREFGFYHVGIFLLDTAKEYAVLSAANSAGGQVMLERGHRLKVGETGIVGYVTGTGEARVALDTGADATFFNNPDLPDTRSEIALPLRVGSEIIGALDVQSTEPDVFAQEDINILSTLADQVSIAIQNARQFEQTRHALNEAEALAKQFAQVGWQQFTRNKKLAGIYHTGARSKILYGASGKEREEGSWERNQPQKKTRGAYLSLPIKLRGEVIGSVDVRSPDNRPWDQDELDIVTAIIERAAIAMENARLLEESQRLASKEAKIGEVTAKISASINMRNVLQTAVEELGHALPGSEVVIQFQTDPHKNRTTH